MNYFRKHKKGTAIVLVSIIAAGGIGYGATQMIPKKNNTESAQGQNTNANKSSSGSSDSSTQSKEIFGKTVKGPLSANEATSIWNLGIGEINKLNNELGKQFNDIQNQLNAIQNTDQLPALNELKAKIDQLNQESENKINNLKQQFQDLINNSKDSDTKKDFENKLNSTIDDINKYRIDNINKLKEQIVTKERTININGILEDCYNYTQAINNQPLETQIQTHQDYINKINNLNQSYDQILNQMEATERDEFQQKHDYTIMGRTQTTFEFLQEWIGRRIRNKAYPLTISKENNIYHYSYTYTS